MRCGWRVDGAVNRLRRVQLDRKGDEAGLSGMGEAERTNLSRSGQDCALEAGVAALTMGRGRNELRG